MEHIARARLVVADLSFHNPNVFYELAFRHATRRPVIHLIRTLDSIPFDLDQFRTIRIDTSGLYSFVPQIETYRAEIQRRSLSCFESPPRLAARCFLSRYRAVFADVALVPAGRVRPDHRSPPSAGEAGGRWAMVLRGPVEFGPGRSADLLGERASVEVAPRCRAQDLLRRREVRSSFLLNGMLH